MKIADETCVGRAGQQMLSVVWPTHDVRFVAMDAFQPFSGEPQIMVRTVAPELTDEKLEVLFEQTEPKLAELFARKCLILLAVWHTKKMTGPSREFYQDARVLYDRDLYHGIKDLPRSATITHGEERRPPGWKVY